MFNAAMLFLDAFYNKVQLTGIWCRRTTFYGHEMLSQMRKNKNKTKNNKKNEHIFQNSKFLYAKDAPYVIDTSEIGSEVFIGIEAKGLSNRYIKSFQNFPGV